ncbi:protein BCCIP homolog [Pristis pectinata]|uniref:protein BCCIP homolog n=1 Tax=Pristis pectinata TaxID=685728 RepID=UPI00223CC47F|nr:protein BCCIP homolog [Pristis pectinata]
MASLAKRRALEDAEGTGSGSGSSGSGEGSGDSGEDSAEELHEEVQIDFEAHTISDSDCNGIKRLLQQLFLKASINLTELADIIIQQNHIGSVIRQAEVLDESNEDDDEDGVFGFITVLNLTERMGTESVEQIKDLVLSQCKTHHPMAAEQLEKILNDNSKPVNFLISERFINVPPQIALPLHKQLQAELVDAQKTNKPCGKCHHYLIISKACMEAGKKKPHQRGKQKEDLMFANAEDEFFYEQSIMKFSYSVEEESDSCLSGRWAFDDVPMKPLRVVMLIPADRLNAVMDKLKEYLSV